MKTRHFSVICVVILFVTMFSHVKAQPTADNKEDARIFVQKFYDWYGALDAAYKPHQIAPFRVVVNKRAADIDVPLRNAIMHYFNSSLKGADMGLDFDPIIAAQDTRSGFQTGDVKQKGNNFFVDVHDIKSGAPQKSISAELILTVEVSKINGQWELVNFIYPPSNGGSNLLMILNNFAKTASK